ncbi:precorrin-2 C20-methyltransferase [Denitrovibrio acetiphilus DSM 12809]|uniref:Precorrin-2 C20-methyltransferase n=1 Tax=Denitrovibrio acetiphilus (strain DSM 12809 / NBRC 114555 / N2460) TaxID=522772 RepID=D4H1Y1_DENA2|nr:precorrin-2 C(20)-methyltransferase [Denitrovibrio acetiphilus]ADD66958.1 precorrin-2 C20-methyltransferase [Denitrovibrio acetiphilus DSM 12809]
MKIFGIGLGPGDPELLTVKAVRILEDADIVIVPQSDKTGRSIAGDIVKHYISAEKIHWYLFPMTGVKADLDIRYDALADTMADMAKDDKKVCYVTIGDTPVYSTFNYLRNRLFERGFEMEMVPGVSAFSAGANSVALPLCEKGENFCVIEMPATKEELAAVLQSFTSVVLMKVHKKLNVLIDFVKENDLSAAYLFHRVTLEDERTYNLLKEEITDDQAGYLSTAIIKK